MLRARYRAIEVFPVDQPAAGLRRTDTLFVPLDRLERLSRPGPAFEVFQRLSR